MSGHSKLKKRGLFAIATLGALMAPVVQLFITPTPPAPPPPSSISVNVGQAQETFQDTLKVLLELMGGILTDIFTALTLFTGGQDDGRIQDHGEDQGTIQRTRFVNERLALLHRELSVRAHRLGTMQLHSVLTQLRQGTDNLRGISAPASSSFKEHVIQSLQDEATELEAVIASRPYHQIELHLAELFVLLERIANSLNPLVAAMGQDPSARDSAPLDTNSLAEDVKRLRSGIEEVRRSPDAWVFEDQIRVLERRTSNLYALPRKLSRITVLQLPARADGGLSGTNSQSQERD